MDLTKIKQQPLDAVQYFQEEHPKKQIVLHHTAGNSSGVNTVKDWNTDNRGKIATCVAISGLGAQNSSDGEIVQAFSSKHWAYHLGIKTDVFTAYNLPAVNLDRISIGIEICNWGQLEKKGNKFVNYVNREIPSDQVTTLEKPHKGYKHFHKYTDAQIASVKELLLYWSGKYNINLLFDYDQMFSVNKKALSGEDGLFTHNSYRRDKMDIYPCPRMINMLKTLS